MTDFQFGVLIFTQCALGVAVLFSVLTQHYNTKAIKTLIVLFGSIADMHRLTLDLMSAKRGGRDGIDP